MESENAEVRKVKKYLYHLLKSHSDMVQEAHDIVARGNQLESNISRNQIEADIDVDAVSALKASVVSALKTEVNELQLEDEIFDDPLLIRFNLLNDLDKESSHKEFLIEKAKKEIAETRGRIKMVKSMLTDIKTIKDARKEEGEMVELRGYSKAQLEKVNLSAKGLFSNHKQELKYLLAKLFPRHADQMKPLLTELTEVAYAGSGETYFDLSNHREMEPAAQLLLQHRIIKRDPNNKKRVCLCIFD